MVSYMTLKVPADPPTTTEGVGDAEEQRFPTLAGTCGFVMMSDYDDVERWNAGAPLS